MLNPKLNIIISGGGTGGHIFPAVAIAQALMKRNPENNILFVGANGRMEMEKVPAAGFRIKGLNIAGFQRRWAFSNVLLPFKIIASLWKARAIVREFKPNVAIGVGGYASGPLLFAATSMGIPALIQEQNSFAGVTNRILAKRAKRICVAYDGMDKYFPKDRILLTGNPVRSDLKELQSKRDEALSYFGLRSDRPVLLVIGGSLGARTINAAITSGIDFIRENQVQLVWQTGKGGFGDATSRVKGLEAEGIKAYEFISRMDLAYAIADVVVSRAGASSVSELALAGKAAILVPSPNVAEDHQTKNAMALVAKQAALLIKDSAASLQLITAALQLIKDNTQQTALRAQIAQLALPDAAEQIAEEVYRLAAKK